jgi:hypothetical protein
MKSFGYLAARVRGTYLHTAVLVGLLTPILITGCVSPAPRSEIAQASKSIEPMTIEMSQDGVAQRGWNGDLTSIPSTHGHQAGKDRHYLFGKGTIAGSGSRAMAAVCFWEDGDPKIHCWPNDRPAWIQLKISGKIRQAYFSNPANSSSTVPASPPLGTVVATPNREWWYGGHSCPYCFWGYDGNCYCWDPCP